MRSRLSGKKIFYMICFAFLCLIDQRIKTGSGLDGRVESFRDMTGIVVAMLILAHYRIGDFRKHRLLYMIWCMAGCVLAAVFIRNGQTLSYFLNDRIVLAVNILLWGIVVIRTAENLLTGNGLPDFLRKPFFCVWLVMVGLMCALRHDIHWQIGYLLMFGCFYLTDYSGEERHQLFQGMLDGVILAFFLMQGWCFAFRPYDMVRYVGVYTNCNHNALFYLIVLGAVLTRLLYVYAAEAAGKAGTKPVFRMKTGYWLLAGVLLGFLFLTISRTGYLTAVVLVMAAFFMRWRVVKEQKWISSMFQSALILGVCFLLTFPAVFGAVRYLPPVFHHPVWFWGEWNEEKVHSWDAWDSEKYIDFDEFFDKAASRVADILLGTKEPENAGEAAAMEEVVAVEDAGMASVAETPAESVTESAEEFSTEPAAESAEPTAQIPAGMGVTELQWERYQKVMDEGYGIDYHVMENGGENSLLIRSTIYRYYLHKLRLTGYPAGEQGFQMLPYYWVGHAHNIYLQWGLEFGAPVMILFILLILWTILCLWKQFRREGDVESAGGLLIFLVPCVFGLLEYCWGTGSLTIFMMFFVWGRMARKEK